MIVQQEGELHSNGQPPHARLSKAVRVVGGIVTQPQVLIAGWRLGRSVGRRRLPVPGLEFALKPFRPFCNAQWDAPEKMRRMADHFRIADALGGVLCPRVGQPRLIAALPSLGRSYWLTCDEPRVMMNDGLTVLSLWQDDLRLFSVSILFADPVPPQAGGHVVYIGGIQGLADDHALDIYRDMTREMHGLRPRDLMIELVRMLATALGSLRLFAVADNSTYQNDRYFGRYPMQVARLDYNAVWRDRGATLLECGAWFDLPIAPQRRSIEDIPARKRSLYRRRYALLDLLAQDVLIGVRTSIPLAPLPSVDPLS